MVLLQGCFASADSFSFPYEFRGKLISGEKKKVAGILIGNEKEKGQERKRSISEWLFSLEGRKGNIGHGLSVLMGL